MKEEKKSITLGQYYQLIGLLTAGRQQTQMLESLEAATANIINLDGEDNYDRGGWLFSDHSWDNSGYETTIKKFLKDNKIEIID